MESTGHLDEIRAFVQSRFAAYGVTAEDGTVETILVRDSLYCGRRFSCDGWRAVWFVEERNVKFFDADGRFRESLDLDALPDETAAPGETSRSGDLAA